MHERKAAVQANRLRRRVREYRRQDVPQSFRERARRQLRKVEGKGVIHARMD